MAAKDALGRQWDGATGAQTYPFFGLAEGHHDGGRTNANPLYPTIGVRTLRPEDAQDVRRAAGNMPWLSNN